MLIAAILTLAVGTYTMRLAGVLLCVVAAVALFAIMLTSSKLTADEHSRVIAFIPLFIGTAAFFALFQQQFTVITVYADTRLDLDVFGWQVPIPWVQSFNPAFIILLAPVFAYLWTTLGKRQPVTATKFGVGLILMGSAFLIFLTQVSVAAVSVWWIALIMLVATMGELMVSPVGLSLSTKLSPEAMPVLMISLYYLAVALGTALSGSLAGFYSADSEAVYFGTLGAITIGIGVITLALSRTITRGMRGIRRRRPRRSAPDVELPGDAEAVGHRAVDPAPDLLAQREGHGSAVGEGVEDRDEALLVGVLAHQRQGDVISLHELARGHALDEVGDVEADQVVDLQGAVHDLVGVLAVGRDRAEVCERRQLGRAAQDLAVELEGLAGVAGEVEVGAQCCDHGSPPGRRGPTTAVGPLAGRMPRHA